MYKKYFANVSNRERQLTLDSQANCKFSETITPLANSYRTLRLNGNMFVLSVSSATTKNISVELPGPLEPTIFSVANAMPVRHSAILLAKELGARNANACS